MLVNLVMLRLLNLYMLRIVSLALLRYRSSQPSFLKRCYLEIQLPLRLYQLLLHLYSSVHLELMSQIPLLRWIQS